MSPGRFSESRAITGAWIVHGREHVPHTNRELRGFYVPGTAGAPDGRGKQFYVLGSAAALPVQQLKSKEYDSGTERSVGYTSAELRGSVRGVGNPEPQVGLFSTRDPLLRARLSSESIRVCETKLPNCGSRERSQLVRLRFRSA